jgi:hypothetical protein
MTSGRWLSFVVGLAALPLACGGRAPLILDIDGGPPSPSADTTGGSAAAPGGGGSSGSGGGATAADAGPSPPSSGTGGSSGASGTSLSSGTGGSATLPDLASPMPGCGATCQTQFVPGNPLADLSAALVGSWQFCSGGEAWHTWAPLDTVGIEFTAANGPALEADGNASGDLFFLVAASNGAPVRVDDATHHLRYSVSRPNQIEMMLPNVGYFGAVVSMSTCPRQLMLNWSGYKTAMTLHVPLLAGDRPLPPALPSCTSTASTSPPMSTDDFCSIYAADCGLTRAGYTTFGWCESSYDSDGPNMQTCQSFHVCNAATETGAARDHDCEAAAALGDCFLVSN